MCTAITFSAEAHYFGRNLDIEHLYGECVTVIPRNFEIKYRFAEPSARHLAIIGMATVVSGIPLLYDGTNEAGLSIAGLNFSGYAKYNEPRAGAINIAGFELPLWVLASCKSTDDARALIEKTNITSTPFNEKLPSAKLHWIISDKSKSITLELTDEGTEIFDNPIGVMANDPPFDFHITGLRRYLNLTPHEVTSRFSDSSQLKPITRGTGAIGLPGDFTSHSRFVRAAFIKLNAKAPEGEARSVEQFFRILDAVSVPDGAVRLDGGNERTEYSSCCNTDEGIYYYKTYDNSRIRAVRMRSERLDADKLFTYPIAEDAKFEFKN